MDSRRHCEFRPVDAVAGVEVFESGRHRSLSLTRGRMVQPRPEQITSPCWLKKTLSCTTNSRSRLMNLSSARACKRDDVVRPRRNVVAPGLPGIDGAGRAHPVIRRRAGEHQQDMDRGRRDQPAIAGGLGVGLVEIDRMILADRFAVEFDRFLGQRVGNGLARLAGDDVVPDLAQIGVFPEIGLEGLRLRHAILPVFRCFSAIFSCRLAEFVI